MTDINHLTKSRRPAQQRPASQYDEGVYGMPKRQQSSALRAGNTGGAPRPVRTSSEDIIADYADEPISRASRTQSTASRRSQSTNGGTSMRVTTGDVPSARRSAATQVQPTQAQPMRQSTRQAKTYMPEPEEQQLNRQQRRHLPMTRDEIIGLALKIVGLVLIALLLLWLFLSLMVIVFENSVWNPTHYGPEQGNVAIVTIDGEQFYFQGINEGGRTFVLEMPVGHPEKAKMLTGPVTLKESMVDIEVKDVNHDGKADIVEHVIPAPGMIGMTPAEGTFTFIGDGHGNFKAAQQEEVQQWH